MRWLSERYISLLKEQVRGAEKFSKLFRRTKALGVSGLGITILESLMAQENKTSDFGTENPEWLESFRWI